MRRLMIVIGLVAVLAAGASACNDDDGDLPPRASPGYEPAPPPAPPTLDARDAEAWEEIQTRFDGFMETWIKWAAEGSPGGFEDPAIAVVCAEWDEQIDVCVLELTITLNGDPPTVSASVSGGGGGVQVWWDRGSHHNPDPGLAQLRQVPCQHGQYGWYSQTYDCYFTATDLPPNAGDVILPGGTTPDDPGRVCAAMCYTPSHPDVPTDNYCFYCVPPGWNLPAQLVFLTSQPDGFEGTPDPVPDLLVTAIEELALRGPTIGTAPPAGQGAGLVRLPVWLWNEVSGTNWGTLTETAGPIAGISVAARAEATGIEWEMGDGGAVHCDEGAAWQAGRSVGTAPGSV